MMQNAIQQWLSTHEQSKVEPAFTPVKLGALWSDVEIEDADITEIRRTMTAEFGEALE